MVINGVQYFRFVYFKVKNKFLLYIKNNMIIQFIFIYKNWK